jgi:hypothetical protein
MSIDPKMIAEVPPLSVPEVKAFLKAKQAFDDWEAQYPVAAKKLRELAPAYNATLKVAELTTKELRVKAMPFDLYSFTRKFDAELLYASVGRQKFAALGGVLATVEDKSIDKDRFVAAMTQKQIAPELAAKVLTHTPNFHKPAPISLP